MSTRGQHNCVLCDSKLDTKEALQEHFRYNARRHNQAPEGSARFGRPEPINCDSAIVIVASASSAMIFRARGEITRGRGQFVPFKTLDGPRDGRKHSRIHTRIVDSTRLVWIVLECLFKKRSMAEVMEIDEK